MSFDASFFVALSFALALSILVLARVLFNFFSSILKFSVAIKASISNILA